MFEYLHHCTHMNMHNCTDVHCTVYNVHCTLSISSIVLVECIIPLKELGKCGNILIVHEFCQLQISHTLGLDG